MTRPVSHGALASDRLELLLDRRAALRDLLVGQRAVGRAELEPQGQRLVALAHQLARGRGSITRTDANRSPAPDLTTSSRRAAGTSSGTITAMSCNTAGKLVTSL
jgi:hypothetical protein